MKIGAGGLGSKRGFLWVFCFSRLTAARGLTRISDRLAVERGFTRNGLMGKEFDK